MATKNGWFKLTKSKLKTIENGFYVWENDTRYHSCELIEIMIDVDDNEVWYADHPNNYVTNILNDLTGFYLFRVPDRKSRSIRRNK